MLSPLQSQLLDLFSPRQVIDKPSKLIIDYDLEIPIPATPQAPATTLRCNLFRPLGSEKTKLSVVMTLSPYGKDIHYRDFNGLSYSAVPDEVKTEYMCWETLEPTHWCSLGYAIIRIDERGFGHSPGYGNIWSYTTGRDFAFAIEWAAEQGFSNGKVGIAGVSYYAMDQWNAASHRPRGLKCMLPWEGSNDQYRQACRNGGIACNGFLHAWYPRQCSANLFPGKGVKSIMDSVPEIERGSDFPDDVIANRYADSEFFKSREIDFEAIEVPCLSVGCLGNLGLHLLGNVDGYERISSEKKWLFFGGGRHDTTMFLPEAIELQKSFLDAFLMGKDDKGWTTGAVPPVSVLLRTTGTDYTDIAAQRAFAMRAESAWPLPATEYTKWNLGADGSLGGDVASKEGVLTWPALSETDALSFTTAPIPSCTEITGHILTHLTISLSATSPTIPKDIDLFITLRHLDAHGIEHHYQGPSGGPCPVTKGWLRCSLRAVQEDHPLHKEYRPFRGYRKEDEEFLEVGREYEVDVEVWPTNVVLGEGERLVLEVASGDTQGSDPFRHNHPVDRSVEVFGGNNHIHFGGGRENYLLLPIIPS